MPRTRIAFAQIVVSAADMAATALIAYAVLPHLPPQAHFGFGTFLAIYIASYTAGLMANVPGGLGVFDGAMIFALRPYLPVAEIMGAILVFRLFYYIIPLVLAGMMFAGHELFLRGEQALVSAGQIRKRIRPSQVLLESEADFSVSVATSVQITIGILLVVYTLWAQLPHLHEALWAAIVQISGLLLTIMGVALVGLALGLKQRVALAWKVSVGVLLASIVLLLLRGAPIVAILAPLLSLVLILPFRNCYYRRAHLLSAPLTPFMVAPITLWGLGLAGVVWVAVERHLGPMWWRAMIYDAHTAKGRWFLALSAVCGLVVLWVGMRRARIRFEEWTGESETRYRKLPRALQEFTPRAPNGLLLDEAGKAAIPFLRAGQFIIGLGDPAGAERNAIAAIWRLRDFAVQEGKHLAFVQVGPSLMAVYNDLGLTVCPAGERGAICCFTEDYRRVKAFLMGEERLARRRAARSDDLSRAVQS
ncbi:transporter [Neokomagataea thailandica NBRC 106555]|uniref:Transporter n=1 Tax=Neokomagataea thailandica NBRC 106555 TaxID=1223520 RepID=A0ABQ0QNQ6_9PROT|nr:transporter [Neokomagataea thailandica NBRC 106555]